MPLHLPSLYQLRYRDVIYLTLTQRRPHTQCVGQQILTTKEKAALRNICLLFKGFFHFKLFDWYIYFTSQPCHLRRSLFSSFHGLLPTGYEVIFGHFLLQKCQRLAAREMDGCTYVHLFSTHFWWLGQPQSVLLCSSCLDSYYIEIWKWRISVAHILIRRY